MSCRHFNKNGETIKFDDIMISKAKKIVELIKNEIVPFTKLIEIKRDNETEIIIFDIEVEVSQVRKNNIKNKERIAITFDKKDNCLPLVEALRIDFPEVPHLNPSRGGEPRSICLFQKTYDEIKHILNPTKILNQIRYWLEATARGDLHGFDQPLEAVMLYSKYNLYLPNNFFYGVELPIFKIKEFKEQILLLPLKKKEYQSSTTSKLFYYPIVLKAQTQEHGKILKIPDNLQALNEICSTWKIDLTDQISNQLEYIVKLPQSVEKEMVCNSKLLIIIYIPKKRTAEGAAESYECRSFIVERTITDLGNIFDITKIFNNSKALIIGKKKKPDNLEKISVIHLNTSVMLSRQAAADYNNECFNDNIDISIIGVGALGSKILMNLVRAGFGKFNLFDCDYFLPHNAARHVLTEVNIGESKTEAMSNLANLIIDEENMCKSYPYNVLTEKKETKSVIAGSDIILDFSTSIAVERYLGIDIESDARRFSVFLNPSGKALVMLVEDIKRKSRIDWLEMQYYRLIINEIELKAHISDFPGDIRYSNSCRDMSNRIPNDYVSIHAATASRVIKAAHKEEKAKLIISQLNKDNFNLATKEYKTYDLIKLNVNGWNVCLDEYFINLMKEKRKEKLPNETGGIILGTFDFERKIIYMVDVYCPNDSIEYPTSFIRGCENLNEKLEEISLNTAGNIEYVGEWHSHPNNCSTAMSPLDNKLLTYLHEKRLYEGYPGVIAIINDRSEDLGIYIK